MNIRKGILTAQSCAKDPRAAAREFYEAVAQPDMALVVFFCSSNYDLDVLAVEMDRLFTGVQVTGCTTAGEIGPAGYTDYSITGASFPASEFTAVTGHIDHLQQFNTAKGQDFAQAQLQRLESKAPHAVPQNSFAVLLIDGLSVREELVTRTLQNALGKLPLIGGSAGDGLDFGSTYVYFEGRFHPDSAVMIMISTSLPFRTFKIQHFVPTDERLVVTEVDTVHRIVKEINGLPAAEEYARLTGVDANDLDPMRFAASPVVVIIDGMNYVRSIQKANSDNSLTFFCAIEEGLVLRVARGVDMVANMEQSFAAIQDEIGPPQLVIGCDCILRKLEILQSGLKDRVADVFRRYNAIGFNTYGEQFRGIHVNQTLTGIVIGTAVSEVRNA
ncbi:MAG TPA: nitric oxide-sensing protein NosP [Smithella sp.]|nr:nitric oxide-sensing protein NosP [Smithella sp.]